MIALPKDITIQQVIDLRKEYWTLWDENLKKTPVYSNDIDSFNKKTQLVGIPKESTPKEIGITLEQWYEILEKGQTNTTPEPKYEQVDSTVPDSERLKVFQEQADDRARQKSEAKIISDKAVEAFLKRQKEIYDERVKLQKNVVVVPTQEIQRITLEKQEKEKLFNLAKAIEIDAGTVQIEIHKKIQEALDNSPEEIRNTVPVEVVRKTAIDLIEKIKPYGTVEKAKDIPDILPTLNSASPFTATLPFDEYSQILAIALESEANLSSTLISPLFENSENITNLLYSPQNITQFEVAEDQERDDGIELDPKEIYEQGKKIKEIWQKLANKTTTAQEVYASTSTYITPYTPSVTASITKDARVFALKALPQAVGTIYGFKQGVLLSQWARSGKMLTAGNTQLLKMLTSQAGVQEVAAASLATFNLPIGFQLGKFSIAVATGANKSAGTQIAIGRVMFGEKWAGAIAVKGGTQVAVVAGTQAGGQLAVGASTVLTKVLTFVGGLSSWATFGLSAIGGYLIGKVVEQLPKIKQWILDNKEVFVGLGAGAGLLIGGPAVGGLVLLGGLAATGSLATFATGAFGVLGFIGRSVGIAIATPVIVTLLVLPPLVAFIMLVINNSAYVVPPSARTLATMGQVVSPYIDIQKVASPAGPFQNSDLPKTIEYTITITAKKSNLTNIKLDEDCTVRKKSGTTQCPKIDPELPDTSSLSISPTSPYSFKYSMTFDTTNFIDSRVSNSITITADSDGNSTTAVGSASVKFGNPPEDCPADWPVYPEDEPYLVILQGPHTSGGTHDVIEAIDIFSPDEPNNTDIIGNQIKATHQGKVLVGSGGNYGRFVDITSSCVKTDGSEVEITSRYAHLSAVSVTTGQIAGKDQTIGLAGSSGTPYPHLHYEFRPAPGPVPMRPPYLPKTIPIGCYNGGGKPCGITY